jgi:NADPH-ferrihemoprotein reductase
VGNNHGKKNQVGYDKAKYPGGQISIYYGSQTGTAQMFAKQLGAECAHRGFVCTRIVDIQDVTDTTVEDSVIQLTTNENSEGEEESSDWAVPHDLDEDGMLLRAHLAHPTFRDNHNTYHHHQQQQQEQKQQYGRSKAIFLVATYGEGEPTDSTLSFVDIMKRLSGINNIHKLPQPTNSDDDNNNERRTTAATTNDDGEEEKKEDNSSSNVATTTAPPISFLRDVEYAVFGLGNKQYEHYNNMGRFVDVALAKCGAHRVAKLGLGDDDDDLEGDFDNWKENVLWPSFIDRYVDKTLVQVDEEEEEKMDGEKKKMESVLLTSLPFCPYMVEYLDTGSSNIPLVPSNENIQSSSKFYTQTSDCTISLKKELRHPSDSGSTLHIEIDISKHMDMMAYHTADNLGIFPRNDSSIVKAVADALHLDLDKSFYLVPNNNTDGGSNSSNNNHVLPFPTPCTVRDCLERYCDLTGSPRRSDLKQLATYATSDLDRKALLRMSTKEGKVEYREKIVDAHVGIADIVTKLCTSIVCPLEHFIMICPRLQPRYYTISSSSLVNPTTIHITLAVLETTTKDGRVFRGLTSNYLANTVNIGDTVSAFVRESTFRLKDQSRPLLMFGPGTGIAPMRAFLQERSYMRNTTEEVVGPSILYFGCKKRTMDYIYRDELEAFVNEKILTQLHLAFSREKKEKVYVQHLLVSNAVETWKLIQDDKASIFVCGAVRMGADVGSALQDIIADQGGMSREKAKAYLDSMAVAGRYVQELWS